MLVKCLIRSATRKKSQQDKDYGLVTIETERPLEISDISIYGSQMGDGTFDNIARCVGKVLELPLKLDSFKGNTKLAYSMGESFQLPAQPSSVQKAGQ